MLVPKLIFFFICHLILAFFSLKQGLQKNYDKTRWAIKRLHYNSKIRLLNSPLLYSTLHVPAVFEAKILPSAAAPTVFELQSELPETSILNSPYCMYSERVDEDELNCTEKISNELIEFGKKSKSKVFFKFQVQPIYGQYDRMTSEITKIEFFKKDKNNLWIHVGTYNLKSQFTYVYEALHDGFTQVFIDLENSSPELYKKLSEIKFTQNYLWSPLSGVTQMYFIGAMNGKKENIIGLDGLPKHYKRTTYSNDEE